MDSRVVEVLSAWGIPGLALVAFLDSAGVPLPTGTDALVVAIAYAAPQRAALASAVAVGGSTAGFVVLYWLARKGGELYLRRHSRPGKTDRVRLWFQKYGLITVFIPTLSPIPLPTKAFVICAGVAGVRLVPFLATVLLARSIRFSALAYASARFGQSGLAWLKANAIWLVLVLVFSLSVSVVFYFKWRSRGLTPASS